MNPLVKISNLNKSYDRFPVLQNLNLTIEQGQIVGLLGPNGCGKTTLMKIMAGLINDYQGNILIDGHAPDRYTKSIVSYLPEKTYLSDSMKAEYAIDMFQDFYHDFDKKKAMELLERFHLHPKQKIKAMSKGMQEKLQLILVMSRAARLYILDEPLSGVDSATRDSLLNLILNNYNENASIILSTHLINDVERIFDSVILLGYGQLIMQDGVDNIRLKTGKSVDELFREVFRC